MHILIAPDSFKESLSAQSVAEAIKQDFPRHSLKRHLTCYPLEMVVKER